jgi:hypothetical protein
MEEKEMSKLVDTVRTRPGVREAIVEAAAVAGVAVFIFFLPYLSNLL